MYFYLLLLIVSTCLAYFHSKAKDPVVAAFFKGLCFLSLFIPAAFRYGIGVDYFAYEKIFLHISMGNQISIEPGYWYLNYFVNKYGGSFQIVVAIMAFFTLYFNIASFPKKYFHLCIPLLILVFYGWTYTTIRQMFVASLAYYCYTRFFTKKKYFDCLLILLFASLFHMSAFFYIPIFIAISLLNVNRKQAFAMFILMILLLPLGRYIIDVLFEPLISGTKYGVYFELNTPSARAPEVTTGLGRLLRFISYAIILLPLIKHKNSREASNALSLFLIIVFFDVLSQQVMVFSRISRGLLFSYFLLFITIVEGKSRYRKIMLVMNYFLLFVLFMGNLRNGINIPYVTIFQK